MRKKTNKKNLSQPSGQQTSHLRLRVELRAEERLGFVSDTLIGTIVNVREKRLPPLAKLGVIDGETVVLGGDVALVRQAVHHRLQGEGV